jgi:demethylmenaquinone methyltransferase/2-methoxy-6-polyprenyl-1,4-benzoquinol methylase
MTVPSLNQLLEEQIAYYKARASEYDEWFLRQGRYDRGPELNQQWFAEVAQLTEALAAFAPTGRVLEFACGTGLWTQHLVRFTQGVTALDASHEVLAINRKRTGSANVRYIEANIFGWHPDTQYDVVFFSFWLSHVPPEQFASFWELVRSCLTPGGRVFFIDGLYKETSTAVDHRLQGEEAVTLKRRLNNGSEYQIVKVFYQPENLAARLGELGWRVTVKAQAHYFFYGYGTFDGR